MTHSKKGHRPQTDDPSLGAIFGIFPFVANLQNSQSWILVRVSTKSQPGHIRGSKVKGQWLKGSSFPLTASRYTEDHLKEDMECRSNCGACCIAPSISSPIPDMPQGKGAGVKCHQLTEDMRCAIFGQPERPSCCVGLQPSSEMCGDTRTEALAWLTQLEEYTRPTICKSICLSARVQRT